MTKPPELLHSIEQDLADTNPLSQGSLTILLVEDNPGDARLVEEFLQEQATRAGVEWAVEVKHVTHMKDASKAVKRSDFDLVLLDMGLPDSQGLDTVRQLRAANAQVALIVLTGNDDQEVALRAMRAGAQDYLVKGQIDSDLLLRAARYAIQRIQFKKSLEMESSANREILASLSAHIAVLDKDGRIVRTNQAWEQFSRENGGKPEATNFGVNYLEVVEQAAQAGSPYAQEAYQAIDRVLSGASELEAFEYPCHAPQEQRWFTMRVTPLAENIDLGIVIAHENVTQRRLAEIELQNRTDELLTILEHAPDIVARYDLEGRHLYVSPSIEKYSGKPPEYYIGKTDQELDVPQERAALWLESINQVIDTGREYQVEYEAQYGQEQGTGIRSFQAKLVPEFDQNNKLQSIVISARDITELRHAQSLLEAREVVLKAVSFSSQLMLSSPDWQSALPQVLQRLGEGAGVQRAYVWCNHTLTDDELVTSQIAEWAARPELALQGSPQFQNVSYAEIGFERWRELLSAGATVQGPIDSFPEEERAFLKPQGIASLLAVPIFAGEEWFGFIGFDNVESGQTWDAAIVDSLRTAAASLGTVINRAQTLELLEEREHRFRSMVQNAGDIITIVEADGTIVYESPALERVMGFKPEDVLGLNVFDPVHPEDRAAAKEKFEHLLDHPEQRIMFAARLFGADGKQRTLEIVGTNQLDDPAVKGVVLNSRDITERIRALEDLRNSELKYRSLAENSIDVIWQMDRRLNFTYVSPSAEELLGASPNEIVGSNLAKYASGVEFFKIARRALGALRSFPDYEPITFPAKLLHEDGVEIEVEITGKILEDEQGKPIGLHGSARDIRNRVEAERALKQSEEQYRSLFNTIQDAIVVIDNDRQITQYNPGFAQIFGYQDEELIGETTEVIYAKASDSKQIGQMGQKITAEGGGVLQLEEVLFKRKSGEEFFGELNAYSLQGDDNEVLGAVAVIRDITERQKAQEALKESEARYRQLFTTIQDGIVTVDEDRTITQCNPGFAAMFGYSVEEMVGNNTKFLYATEDIYRSIGEKARSAALTSDGSIEYSNVRLLRKNGQEFIAEINADTLYDSRGHRVGNVGVFRDVTDRLKAQQALKSSEVRYRSLFKSIRDAILVADQDRNIVQCNPAFTEIFGYTEDEIRGSKTVTLYKDPEEFALMGEKINELRAEGKRDGQVVTVTYRRKSGEIFPGETGVYTLKDLSGNPIGAIGLIRDVTDRERRQNEQQAIAQVAEALRAAANRDEMPPIILYQLLDLLDAGGAEMVLTNKEQDRLWVELGVGSWHKFTGLELDIKDNIAGQILLSDDPFQADDLELVPRFRSINRIENDRAAAAVSMKAGEVPVGVIWVARSTPFSDDEVQVLKAIGDMAGNALRRAGLHEETQLRAQQMSAVSVLGQDLAEHLDEFAIYERLVDGVKQLIPGVSNVIISRLDLDSDQFQLAYGEDEGQLIDVGEMRPVRINEQDGSPFSEVMKQHRPVLREKEPDERIETLTPFAGRDVGNVASGLFVPIVSEGKLLGIIQMLSSLNHRFSQLDAEIMTMVANTAAVALENAELLKETQGAAIELAMAYDTTLEGWAKALELRDKETEGHTRRVSELTVNLAASMQVPAEQLVNARRGALLHDIGKMGIPDSILLKPGKLTEDEWEIMRQHPQMAYDMLKSVDFLLPALTIPLYHHERWDGSGYPEGLRGEAIPLVARIFAVIDVYDALSSNRPYRKAWPPEKVQQYLQEKAGVEFDPAVVEAFFDMMGFPAE